MLDRKGLPDRVWPRDGEDLACQPQNEINQRQGTCADGQEGRQTQMLSVEEEPLAGAGNIAHKGAHSAAKKPKGPCARLDAGHAGDIAPVMQGARGEIAQADGIGV